MSREKRNVQEFLKHTSVFEHMHVVCMVNVIGNVMGRGKFRDMGTIPWPWHDNYSVDLPAVDEFIMSQTEVHFGDLCITHWTILSGGVAVTHPWKPALPPLTCQLHWTLKYVRPKCSYCLCARRKEQFNQTPVALTCLNTDLNPFPELGLSVEQSLVGLVCQKHWRTPQLFAVYGYEAMAPTKILEHMLAIIWLGVSVSAFSGM